MLCVIFDCAQSQDDHRMLWSSKISSGEGNDGQEGSSEEDGGQEEDRREEGH